MTQPSNIPPHVLQWAADFWDAHLETDQVEMVALAFMAGQGGGQPVHLGLTKGQSIALAFINEFQAAKGFAPTYREIGDHLCVSKSGVHRLVHGLVSRGALSMIPGGARSIAITQHAAVSTAHNFSGVN